MTDQLFAEAYGELATPTTLRIQRRLPGPIERVWDYLTDSELRRQWLAAGDMQLLPGTSFELVWRNDELTDPPGVRPATHSAESRLTCELTEVEPPHRLGFTWGKQSAVTFALEAVGTDVILTIEHLRVNDRTMLLNVSPGWHMHLDILAARLTGGTTEPFWDGVARLKADYAERFPA